MYMHMYFCGEDRIQTFILKLAPAYEVILGASFEDDFYWSIGQAPPRVPCAPPSSQAHKSATSVPRQPPGHLQLLLNRSG